MAIKKFAFAYHRSFALRLTLGFAAAALLLTFIGILAMSGTFNDFDDWALSQIEWTQTQPLTAAMRFITRFGSTTWLLIAGSIFSVALLVMRWWRDLSLFLIAAAGQAVLHIGFKWIFDIERPQPILNYIVDDSTSFPSGHALASLTIYGAIASILAHHIRSRSVRITIWLITLTLVMLIAASRMYFNVHHTSDVIAGILAAAIWTASVLPRPRESS